MSVSTLIMGDNEAENDDEKIYLYILQIPENFFQSELGLSSNKHATVKDNLQKGATSPI